MAKRIYRMRRIYYSKDPASTLKQDDIIRQYRDVVFDWNDSVTPNLSKLEIFFGRGLREKFEHDVMPKFVQLGTQAEWLFKNDDRAPKPADFWSELDSLNSISYEFDKSLLRLISSRIL